jgi:hypothetical protein
MPILSSTVIILISSLISNRPKSALSGYFGIAMCCSQERECGHILLFMQPHSQSIQFSLPRSTSPAGHAHTNRRTTTSHARSQTQNKWIATKLVSHTSPRAASLTKKPNQKEKRAIKKYRTQASPERTVGIFTQSR